MCRPVLIEMTSIDEHPQIVFPSTMAMIVAHATILQQQHFVAEIREEQPHWWIDWCHRDLDDFLLQECSIISDEGRENGEGAIARKKGILREQSRPPCPIIFIIFIVVVVFLLMDMDQGERAEQHTDAEKMLPSE